MFESSPELPYYAVVFSSIRTSENEGYLEMDKLIYDEVEKNVGYLGHEGTRQEDGFGIHVSYWKDLESIKIWKNNTLHQRAKKQGKENWYKSFRTRICKVEREY